MPSYDAPYQWSPHLYGLIEEGERPTDRLAVCSAHQGRHPYYLGGCQAIPRGLSKRERHALYARSVPRQPEPEPLAVDVESMAQAIVAASRATRQERRQEHQTRTVLVADPEPPMPREDLSAGWGVPVVKPDDAPA